MATKQKGTKKAAPSREYTRREEARIARIHERIQAKTYPTVPELAELLRTSPRTIERDIFSMRHDRNLPIEVSRKNGRKGYYYSRPVSTIIGRTFTEQDLLELFMGHRAISQIPVKKRQKRLGLDFGKISQLVDSRTAEMLDEMQDTVYFRPFAPEAIDIESFRTLADGIRSRRVVRFAYKKHLAEMPELKAIRPYCFTCAANAWYLIGFDTEKGDVRTYLLSRATDVLVTDEAFEKPDFCLDEYLEGCFIIMKGKESHDVVIEFNAWAAPYIRNRTFVKGQKIEELADGGLRISFWLSCLNEVELWVQYWGLNATVIGPEPFRARMYKYGMRLTERYVPRGEGAVGG